MSNPGFGVFVFTSAQLEAYPCFKFTLRIHEVRYVLDSQHEGIRGCEWCVCACVSGHVF